MFLLVGVLLGAADAEARERARIKARAGLNLRAGPNGRVLGALGHGDEVEVLEERGGWSRVETPRGVGWMFSRHLETVQPPPAPTRRRGMIDAFNDAVDPGAETTPPRRESVPATPIARRKTGRVNAPGGLNVRTSPNGAKIGALKLGDEVEVVGKSRDGAWLRVRTPFGEGWVYAKHLSKVGGDSSTRGPTPSGPSPRSSSSQPASARPSNPSARPASSSPRGTSSQPASSRNTASSGGAVDRRNLSGLEPAFRAKVERILRALQAKGWQPYVAEGHRTRAQQREKVRLGYSRTMNSLHIRRLAADIVDRRWGWEGPAKNQNHPFWRDLGRAAAAEGLTWGGNWRSFKDVAHVQAR